MRICIWMDPDFFITVLHVPDGPHFSKSGTAMVVPVVAGATPLHLQLKICSVQFRVFIFPFFVNICVRLYVGPDAASVMGSSFSTGGAVHC